MTSADTSYQIEHQRIRFRRQSLQQEAPETGAPGRGNWGLALSGGGIRSATFGLGVLQAMARAPAPAEAQPQPAGAREHLSLIHI